MGIYSKLMEDNKPSKIEINLSTLEVLLHFNSSGSKRFTVKTKEDVVKVIKEVEELYQARNRMENEDIISFDFDWTIKTPSFTDERATVLKDDSILREPSATAETTATAEAVTTTVATPPSSIDYSDDNNALEEILRIVTDEDLFTVTATSNGILIKNGEVCSSTIDPIIVRTIYSHFAKLSNKTSGIFSYNYEKNGIELNFEMIKVGDEESIVARRIIPKGIKLPANMSGEMVSRMELMSSGIITISMHEHLKMDYAMKMIERFDKNVERLSIEVGDCFNDETYGHIAHLGSMANIEPVLKSHFKYVFVNNKELKLEVKTIMELMYSGKFVILGVESDGIYNNLISLIDICGEQPLMVNKLLTSTVGFVYPILSYKNGVYSLENTESITLNSTRLSSLLEGDLSREKFLSYIEHPCKTFRLKTLTGSEVSSNEIVSQKEELDSLLKQSIDRGASDVQLAIGAKPMFRINQTLVEGNPDLVMTPEIMKQLVSTVVTTEIGAEVLRTKKELGLSYSISGVGRFRVQISVQRGTYCMFFRHTPFKIPKPEVLRLPQRLLDVVLSNPQGLFLSTGATSTGKSTTNAALIEALKNDASYSITTLSEPIEYLYSHGKSIVTQREIPTDIGDYQSAINSTFRMDPDIVELTEMRDIESILALLRFALSGHLVLSSYHTSSVLSTVSALASIAGEERKQEIMSILSASVIAISNQILIPRKSDGKAIAVFEYLIPDKTVRMYIEQGREDMIEGMMKTSAKSDKMLGTWMDYELCELYLNGVIDEEVFNDNLRDKNSLQDYTGNYS